MPIFEYRCSSCGRETILDPDGACQNRLNNGQICGCTFPLRYGRGNSKVREKMNKHSNPPPTGYSGDYSWVDDSGVYPIYQIEAARHGSINLDPKYHYLFLFCAPSGETPIAKVLYGTGSDVQYASGIVMPLNSQLQNMHIHFDNYQQRFVRVADGTDLAIQQPNSAHPNEYHILSGNQIMFKYDFANNSWEKP